MKKIALGFIEFVAALVCVTMVTQAQAQGVPPNGPAGIGYTAATHSYSALPRRTVAADATSITPDSATADVVTQANTQGAGTLTLNAPTGSPLPGQRLTIRITSTNSQTLSFNAAYRASTQLPFPASTTGSSKTDYMVFMWNSTASKWDFVGANFGF